MSVEQNPHLTPGALREHLGNLLVAFKHVFRQRELTLQGANQRPPDGAARRHNPRDGTPVAGQLNGLPASARRINSANWALASAMAICMGVFLFTLTNI
ncbi:hypothetical protein U5922_000585 (plasmid) [Aquicoccus sp. G2-2]|uniref:hypothetical protein n=1 Tax=Aquicoccus sp. G2-2 TaxID=3092120 RepID=UPI002ADFEB4C|nr:hypothetical protein [Aquicoccus sp. G2-2]MEA1112029.1 hypothetical protein [Aquicoccus sp. G2-2]